MLEVGLILLGALLTVHSFYRFKNPRWAHESRWSRMPVLAWALLGRRGPAAIPFVKDKGLATERIGAISELFVGLGLIGSSLSILL